MNRGVAVLKNMLTFALERDIIEMHPLLRFRMLKEERPALRVMTLQEERRLIDSIDEPSSQRTLRCSVKRACESGKGCY